MFSADANFSTISQTLRQFGSKNTVTWGLNTTVTIIFQTDVKDMGGKNFLIIIEYNSI